jgi:hypothetical protein
MAVSFPDSEARAARARLLVDRHPAAAGPLTFFAGLIELQRSIAATHRPVLRSTSRPPPTRCRRCSTDCTALRLDR